MTSMPEPSGFRTADIDKFNARFLAYKLVSERITFNHSEIDGLHQFVYPVKHDKRVKELVELLK